MALIDFWIFIETYASLLSLMILSVTSIIFGYTIPYIVDPSIEKIESELKEKGEFFDGLKSDYDQFQNWEAKGMTLRDSISILRAVNLIAKNEDISKLITIREQELQYVKTTSIISISAKLNIPDNEIITWRDLDFDASNQKKIELSIKWGEAVKSTLSDINSLVESTEARKRFKTRIVLGTIVFQSIGAYLSFTGSRA